MRDTEVPMSAPQDRSEQPAPTHRKFRAGDAVRLTRKALSTSVAELPWRQAVVIGYDRQTPVLFVSPLGTDRRVMIGECHVEHDTDQGNDGAYVRFDEATGLFVAWHLVSGCGATVSEAVQCLKSAIRLTAESAWCKGDTEQAGGTDPVEPPKEQR